MKLSNSLSNIVVFIISAIIFSLIVYLPVLTDIQAHAKKAISGVPINFLYYISINTFALFSKNLQHVLISAIFILSLSIMLKFIVTKAIIYDYFKEKKDSKKLLLWLVPLSAFLLLFSFNLPAIWAIKGPRWAYFYLGQTPSNVWHNSTVIFLMPFALSLFWLSYKQLVDPKNNRVWIISLLVLVNIFIKPSFIFVFLIVYPLMLLKEYRLQRNFWLNIVPLILAVVLIYIEHKIIFTGSSETGIKLSLFSVWSHYSSNIFLSLLVSLVFPLTFLCFYWKDIFKKLLLQYVGLAYLVAVLIHSFLSETGPREFHGNFGWQKVVCSYFLFMVISIFLMEKILNNNGVINRKNKIIIGSFVLHVISGLLYLAKTLILRSYA